MIILPKDLLYLRKDGNLYCIRVIVPADALASITCDEVMQQGHPDAMTLLEHEGSYFLGSIKDQPIFIDDYFKE